MQELREEVGVKESFRRKLVRSWLKWAGEIESGGENASKVRGGGGGETRTSIDATVSTDFSDKQESNTIIVCLSV